MSTKGVIGMQRIISTIKIQQVFSSMSCSANMNFEWIPFTQQMIFCMPEFAVKTAERVPGRNGQGI